jgi:beta-lactamase regulating signal transducer with metallopeptidase domain
MSAAAELWTRLALLGLAGVIGEWALRRANGAVRHALWMVVVAAALALPLARVAFEEQTWTVGWWRAPAAAAPVETALGEAAPGPAAAVDAPSRAAKRRIPYEWLLYVAVAAVLLGRQVRAALRLRAIRRRAKVVQPEEALEVAVQLGVAEPVEFVSSAEVAVPFTAGWRRCRIFLPADWTEWPAMKRQSVLTHEMAHVQRGDWLVGRAAAALRAVFWAHPLFWWAERRLAALAEEAVDETTLALTGDARAYAGAILDFVLARMEHFEGMETTAMVRSSKVSSRVERILSTRNFHAARIGRLTAASIVGAALPLLYAAALVEPAPQQAPAPEAATYLAAAPVSPAPVQAPAAASELAAAEAKAAANPEDPQARLELVQKFTLSGRQAEAETHAVWLVENQPSSLEAIMATQIFVGHFGPAPAGRRLSALWRRNAEKYPGDASVLTAAARMAQLEGEFVRADALLRQALTLDPSLQPAQQQRAALYQQALLAGSGAVVLGGQPEPAFIEMARRLADSGTEMPLVGAVGEVMTPPDSLTVPSEKVAEAASKLRAARLQLAEKLLRRAEELDPENPRWKGAMERLERAKTGGGVTIEAFPAAEPGTKRITVGGNVQAFKLVKSVEPVYPPLARQARIQGAVRFTVLIDKAGGIAKMVLISGHPLLVLAALKALQQYEYQPTILGGEPVEVVTQVDIHFTLSPPAEFR